MSELERLPETGLPTFESRDWDSHVAAWREVHDQLEERLWALGAIAASLTRSYGDKAIPAFASEVNYSARRVWELAATYKAWENRDRAHDLSFKHHTIAARAEDPDEAIEMALTSEKPMSAEDLRVAIKGQQEPRAVEVVATTRPCEACGGTGEVPLD